MSHCPSCGQFAGPHDTCPHCGAHLGGRMAIRTIKIAAVGVTVVGLLFLWLLANRTESPIVPIGQVGATMNLAYVRLEGRVTRGPSFDPDSHALAFWLADDSGELYVAAYRHEAEELVALGRVPALGDRVSVLGTLRIREDFSSLTINSADRVTVTRPASSERFVAEIDPRDDLERVRLRGQVRDIRSPYAGLTLIGLRDASGAIDIAVPKETLALTGDLITLSAGQIVEVEGVVSLYKETPQVTLTDAADVTLLDEPADVAPIVLVSDIDAERVGKWVGLQGLVTSIVPFSAGVKLTLDDGSGEITVLLWQDLYDELVATTELEEGAALNVYGLVSEYRGRMELIPELPIDVQLAAASLSPEERAIGSLSGNDVGRRVRLTGTLGKPDRFSAGVKFVLADGSGEITLLLWQDVYDAVGGRPSAGARVHVRGTVAEYKGELEIIPRIAADIVLLDEPSPTPVATSTELPTATPLPTPTFQVVCTPPPCKENNEVYHCPGECPGGCGTQCATPTGPPSATSLPTPTFQVVCTPPPCKGDEVYYCPGECPGGCGTQCATRTPAASPTTAPVPTDTPTPIATPTIAATPMGEIDALRAGETLTVRGQVAGTASFSAGFQFTLDDGTGQIVLLLWEDVYDAVADRAGLNVGATVLVTGEIGEYEGDLQIVPTEAGEVAVENAGGGPDAPRREIGSLSAADVGSLVEIEGIVSRAEGFGSGLRVYITDGTGEVQLLLWQNVADRVVDGDKLIVGARLRAIGEVGEYRGTRQVVPRLPFDVEVLP